MTLLQRLFSVVAWIGAVCVNTNCVAQERPVAGHRDSTLRKSPEEVARLTVLAKKGDGNAAWSLFLHYGLGVRDTAAAKRWLELANQLGNENARRQIAAQKTVDGK